MRILKPSALSIVAAALAVPLAAACLTTRGADELDHDADTRATASELSSAGACSGGDHYRMIRFVPTTADASCPNVVAEGGAWAYEGPTPVTACAPKEANDPRGVPIVCKYVWTPSASSPAASPDVAALLAVADAYVASDGAGGVGSCDEPSPMPFIALQHQAGVTCPVEIEGDGGPTGPATCDVCAKTLYPGVVGGTDPHLVLPHGTKLRTFVVRLSNGTKQVVTIGDGATHVLGHLVVPLAAPPRGLTYSNGAALGYGYRRD